MRVLDEVAEAIRRARGCRQQPVLTPFALEEQFDYPLTTREWAVIQQHLRCPLPPLEFTQGHWFLPDGFATIWDLVDHAARWHPEWEFPVVRTEEAWREAQIFAGVKIEIMGALAVESMAVTRRARLKADLGLVC
jgi:hypothetical protein